MGLDALSWQREERAGHEAGRVERAHPLDQGTDERRAFVTGERLIGDRPQHDRRATAITQHEFVGLLERVGQCGLVGPLDTPVDGKFDPSEHPSFVGLCDHRLIVLIVRQTNEVGAEFLGPVEQCGGVLGPRGPRAAGRAFGMHRDAFQENHLAIDDDVASSRLDGAEADRVGHAIGARLEDDLVQPRGTRVPALVFGNVRCRHGEALVGRDLP